MEDTQKSKGSVYQQWHATLLKNYILVLSLAIRKLALLPTSEFYIPDGDIHDLLELAEFFEVEIPEDADLKDIQEFKKYLGKIKNKAKKTVLEDLKPTDPYAQIVNALGEADIRQMEGEKV
mgnify:CR=1 FL=1